MTIKYAIKHLTSKPLITIDKAASAQKAVEVMLDHNVGCVVVTQKDKPVGIVTERDVLRKGELFEDSFEVGTLMSMPLITIDAEAPIGKAAELMIVHKIRRLLVEENGEIVGIVTQRDLMRGTLDVFHAIQSLGL